MAAVTSVDIIDGVPVGGSGEVMTIDALAAVAATAAHQVTAQTALSAIKLATEATEVATEAMQTLLAPTSDPVPVEVVNDVRVFQIVPSSNTDAHTTGDLIAATEVWAAVAKDDDACGILKDLNVTRLDSVTGVDIRVWFLKANSSMGAESAAFAIADGDADDILFYVDFVAADFVGLGATNCLAQKSPNKGYKPATGTDDVYIAVTATGSVDIAAATDLLVTGVFI